MISLTRTSDSINTRLIIDSLNTAHMKNGVIAAISPFCLHGIMKEKTPLGPSKRISFRFNSFIGDCLQIYEKKDGKQDYQLILTRKHILRQKPYQIRYTLNPP